VEISAVLKVALEDQARSRDGRGLGSERLDLGGGISSLAAVSVVSNAATLVLIATTAAGVRWPDSAFRVMAALLLATVIIAQTRSFSSRRAIFGLGVLCASLPSLVIAAGHLINQWDDFQTWLPNALYIWTFGALPTPALPSVASYLPGYPPGSTLILAAVWSVAGRVVDTAGPTLNVACLMVLPGVFLRALDITPDQAPVRLFMLGAVLGAIATVLNVGLDWHWALSSLPETATLVAFAAAFQLGAESLFRKSAGSRSKLIALAALLAFVVNLKQTGIVLVGILLVALSLVAWTWRDDERRSMRDSIQVLALVCAPSIALWLGWHIYLTKVYAAYTPVFRPIGQWYFSLLPDFLREMARNMAEHWLFTVPVAIVVARGWYVLGRGWLGHKRIPPSPADRLAAIFALIEAAYVGFLVICYLGGFEDRGIVAAAAEWFRYQAQVGGAGLLVGLALAVERLQPVRFVTLMPVALLLPFAMAWKLSYGPGVYEYEGVLSKAAVQSVRHLGREVGKLVAASNTDVNVDLVAYDDLAGKIMRYEIWASAPSRVRSFEILSAANETEVVAALRAAIRRAFHAVVEVDGDARCAVHADGARVTLVGNGQAPAVGDGRASAICLSIAHQLALTGIPGADDGLAAKLIGTSNPPH
jgi:hypothetical protein